MRCYYEELGIARDSNESDIKTAYRKLALRWHPDKNPESLSEAKERFQLIQQAYEVLSDAQERAWYDNHREQILRGKNSEYSENCLDVFQYFTGSCYKGYGNDAKGFYSVYRDVFNNIASEDLEFMDSDDEMSAPQFGNAESSYEDVVGPFYAYWLSYSTKKTYEWLCPYDVRDIKERFLLRKVEKEMKKIVQNARKDRNEEVRNLVSFVRKRDRRVHAYRLVLEERAEANRLKQEEKRKEQLRQRQEQLAAVRANKVQNDGYEEQLRQLEQEYDSNEYTDEDEQDEDNDDVDSEAAAAAESDNDLSEQEVEYVDDLYCVACNKSFKNAKARANHEESKKHRDNVERLCQQMEAEEQEYNEHSEDIEATEESLKDLEIKSTQKTDQSDQAELSSEAEETKQAQTKRNKKSKKSKKAAPKAIVESEEDEDAHEAAADQQVDFTSPASNSENADDDAWSRNKKSAKKSKSKKPASSSSSKQKAETEKVTMETKSQAKSASTKSNEDEPLSDVQHTCVTCKLVFDSKNKLFAHLKKTNHGVYIPKSKPAVEGKPPGKAKGKRK